MTTAKRQRTRLSGAARRTQILEAAFSMIARGGLESFRTGDLAERVGINNATLHYHFPTKEDLVRAVGTHLAGRYAHERSPALASGSSAVAALRREFNDAAFYRRERPDMLAVSREFTMRAARDEQIAAIIGELNQQWRRSVEATLQRGVSTGEFRADLNPPAASTSVVATLWAATVLFHPSDAEFQGVCLQLEHWIVQPDSSRKGTDDDRA